MQMTSNEIDLLEKVAEENDGHCDRCGQTIKIYHYKINKSHANFLKAMAQAVRDSGVNDVDISTLGLSYSVRTQVTKMRLHGLIARVKNDAGMQIPRRWLITHKGWEFLNGNPVPEKVIVYNNQVLGHNEVSITISKVLGERFDPQSPIYAETPVSEPEARVYEDARQPHKSLEINAYFRGRNSDIEYKINDLYSIVLERLQVGKPVTILNPHRREYRDIAAFLKEWKLI